LFLSHIIKHGKFFSEIWPGQPITST